MTPSRRAAFGRTMPPHVADAAAVLIAGREEPSACCYVGAASRRRASVA
jgi:hypothetical protein